MHKMNWLVCFVQYGLETTYNGHEPGSPLHWEERDLNVLHYAFRVGFKALIQVEFPWVVLKIYSHSPLPSSPPNMLLKV